MKSEWGGLRRRFFFLFLFFLLRFYFLWSAPFTGLLFPNALFHSSHFCQSSPNAYAERKESCCSSPLSFFRAARTGRVLYKLLYRVGKKHSSPSGRSRTWPSFRRGTVPRSSRSLRVSNRVRSRQASIFDLQGGHRAWNPFGKCSWCGDQRGNADSWDDGVKSSGVLWATHFLSYRTVLGHTIPISLAFRVGTSTEAFQKNQECGTPDFLRGWGADYWIEFYGALTLTFMICSRPLFPIQCRVIRISLPEGEGFIVCAHPVFTRKARRFILVYRVSANAVPSAWAAKSLVVIHSSGATSLQKKVQGCQLTNGNKLCCAKLIFCTSPASFSSAHQKLNISRDCGSGKFAVVMAHTGVPVQEFLSTYVHDESSSVHSDVLGGCGQMTFWVSHHPLIGHESTQNRCEFEHFRLKCVCLGKGRAFPHIMR